MKRINIAVVIIAIFLSACGSQPQAAPTITTIPPTATALPTETPVSPTDTPSPTQDPTLFGAIGVNEVQGMVLETFANAIFVKTMNSLKDNGAIQDFQPLRATVFPGDGGLIFEVIFNVQTTDPAWLADGGTPAADNWVNDKCYRFDFVTTETEYQLRNKRLCG